MFQYNPTVNDRSGEITAGYQTKSAEIKAAGNEALADGIMRGATSAIGGGLGAATGFNTAGMITDAKGNSIPGLGEALDSVKANAIKYDTAAGMMDSYKQFGSQMGIKAEDIDALGAKHAKNPDALIASLAVLGRVADNNMSMKREQARMDGYKNLADYKSSLGAASTDTAPRMNAENIRSMVAEAKAAGFSDDAIKAKLQSQYGDWAVRSVYPPQNQGIWMGQ